MEENELKYFKGENLSKAKSLKDASKEEKIAFKNQLKEFYLLEDKKLKEENEKNFVALKKEYADEIQKIEEEKKQNLSQAEENFNQGKMKDEKEHSDIIKGILTMAKERRSKLSTPMMKIAKMKSSEDMIFRMNMFPSIRKWD